MTSAELLTWLQWHHEHAPYIWGGIAATAVGVRALQQRWRREQQEPDAAWATMRQVREAKLDGQHGLVIGGYRGHMLRYHGEGHVIIVAPPRTGKTSSIVVPTLLEPHPQTSVLVNDPKGELYRMTQRYRRTISRVYRLDPTNLQSDHYNPFDAVRIGTPHEAGDLRLLARLLTNPDNKESKDATVQFWDDATAMAAQAFILCGLLTGQGMNPGSLYDLMSTRTIADLLTDLEGTLHPLCCQAAQTLREMTDGGQKSVIMGIRKSLQIYSDGLVARMTAHSDFRAEDLRAGPQPLTIYCTLPFGQDDVLNVMRVIFRQLLGGAMQTNPAPSTQRQSMHGWDYDVLVLADEFPSLQKMDIIPQAINYGAGFGVRLCLITPSLKTLDHLYGPNNFLESTAVQIYFSLMDEQVSGGLALRLGEKSVTQVRMTQGRGGRSWTRERTRKPLLDRSGILHLDSDQVIITARGRDKIQLIARQYPWYRYKPWSQRGESLQ